MSRPDDGSPRVLWVTNDLPPRHGGIESFIGELLQRTFLGSTHVIGPYHPDGHAYDLAQPYTVTRCPGKVLPSRALLRIISEQVETHHPDIIVFGALWPLGHLAAQLKRRLNRPILAISHGHEAGLASVGAAPLLRHATRHIDVLTTISAFTEQRLRRGNRAAVTVRVPPGVDTQRFTPAGASRVGVLGQIPDGAPIVGALSRMVRRKGFDQLIAAWPAVHRAHPDAWLVIAGDGPDRARLVRHAATHPDANILFLGAPSRELLPATYRSFDVFAQPARTRNLGLDVEGLGIVFLEAQASGVPLVVGASGGAPETVRSDTYGTVVNGRDPHAIATAITHWLNHPSGRVVAAEHARNAAEQHWSWPSIAARFVAAVDMAIDTHRRASRP